MYKEISTSQQQQRVFDVMLNNSNSHQNGGAGLSGVTELTCAILLFQKNPLYTGTLLVFTPSISYVPATEEGRSLIAYQEAEASWIKKYRKNLKYFLTTNCKMQRPHLSILNSLYFLL